MKSGRVVSPAGVGGELLKVVRFAGLANSAWLTAIRPAKPVTCEPLPVIAPVKSEPASVNNGNCGLPDVSEDTVVVTEAALTVASGETSLSMRSVEPDGFENCRWFAASAAFNCVTTEASPPEKLTPMTRGLTPGGLGSGNAVGSSTRTIDTCCCLPVVLSV